MTSRGHLLPLFFRRWMDTLAPRPCAVCGMRLGACEQLVCVGCNLSLPRTGYALNPYDNDMAMLFWHLAPVDKAAALFFYKAGSPTARAIYKLKYYSRPDIGYGLGQLMARELAANGFFDDINLIVPVPLSPKRKRQRGYNQRGHSGWLGPRDGCRHGCAKPSPNVLPSVADASQPPGAAGECGRRVQRGAPQAVGASQHPARRRCLHHGSHALGLCL